MSIYIGTNKLKEVYLGTNKVKEIYLGTDLAYRSGFYLIQNGKPKVAWTGYGCAYDSQFTSGYYRIESVGSEKTGYYEFKEPNRSGSQRADGKLATENLSLLIPDITAYSKIKIRAKRHLTSTSSRMLFGTYNVSQLETNYSNTMYLDWTTPWAGILEDDDYSVFEIALTDATYGSTELCFAFAGRSFGTDGLCVADVTDIWLE